MAGSRVRLVRTFDFDYAFDVEGVGRLDQDGGGDFCGPAEVVGPASITSLMRSFRQYHRYYEGNEWKPGFQYRLWVSAVAARRFDPDDSPIEPIEFRIDAANFSMTLPWGVDAGVDVDAVSRLVADVCRRVGAVLIIDVPPQREERRPFLVSGAIVHGRGRQSRVWWRPPLNSQSIASPKPRAHQQGST